MGYEPASGYMTCGGSEANLAGIWWCKLWLRQQCRPNITSIKAEIKETKQMEDSDAKYEKSYKLKQALKR